MPFEQPRQLLSTTWGEISYFLFFLLAIAVLGPKNSGAVIPWKPVRTASGLKRSAGGPKLDTLIFSTGPCSAAA
ncbi:MAG: hypothetical protein JRE58_03795 [Deltaproteobacteria bacterium]|nr:hypothetical protein [Deltaproteobacteria bacterium]